VAGWPSLRKLAREAGCSPTTISAAFSAPKVPRWGLLEIIVETLDGDVDEFHRLWLAASRLPEPGPAPAQAAAEPSAEATAGTAAVVPEVPRQLPGDVVAFTGREAEIAVLESLRQRTGPAARVAVVCGTAGVGKTALAVHWAQASVADFPDGQLYLNLRGYDPAEPLSPGEALAALLVGLGVERSRMPTDTAQRAARLRSLLADRRILLVLDNAQSVEQVRDLLPGDSSCLAVITSRSRLSGLVVRYGAVSIPLDLLAADEADRLLGALIGPRANDDRAVRELSTACARLPLALRIAAERAASRPAAPLDGMVTELADTTRRLDLLATGDEFGSVRAVFSWSCDQLTDDEDRAFRLLGTIGQPDIEAEGAGALLGVPLEAAAATLEALARVHLLDERRPGRFAMHDLLRAFALDRSRDLPAAEVAAARDRLLACHLRHLSLESVDRAWLDREWPGVVATARSVVDARPDHAVAVAEAVAGYLDAASRFEAGEALHLAAREAARRLADPAAEGWAVTHLAEVHRRLGRFAESEEEYSAALDLHRTAGSRSGEARALLGLGRLGWRRGDALGASRPLARACEIFREVGDDSGAGAALYNLGITARRLGDYAMAEKYHLQAIDILVAAGDRDGEARARNNLSLVRLHLGRYDEAVHDLERALEIHRGSDDVVGQAIVLDNLGTASSRRGDFARAREHHERALALYRDVGYRTGEGDALRGLGVALTGLGEFDAARPLLERAVELGAELGESAIETGARLDLADLFLREERLAEAGVHLERALAIADRSEDRNDQARAWAGLAELRLALGDRDAGAQAWRAALRWYDELGVPEAETVRRRLAESLSSAQGATGVSSSRDPMPTVRDSPAR